MLVKMLSVLCVNSVSETPHSQKLSDAQTNCIDWVKDIVSWQLPMGVKTVAHFFPRL